MSKHLTTAQLIEQLDKRKSVVPVGSVWYHWKDPQVLYVIVDLVIDESCDEVAVVYEQPTGIRFVRGAKIFVQEVIYSSEQRGPRFVWVS